MDTEQTILARVKRTANLLDRFMNEVKADIEGRFEEARNISTIQGRIVAYLGSRGKAVLQKEIEAVFDIRSSTVAIILRRMEKNGLITRATSEESRRMKTVALTQKAWDLIPEVNAEIEKAEKRITRGVARRDLATFVEVLDRIAENIG